MTITCAGMHSYRSLDSSPIGRRSCAQAAQCSSSSARSCSMRSRFRCAGKGGRPYGLPFSLSTCDRFAFASARASSNCRNKRSTLMRRDCFSPANETVAGVLPMVMTGGCDSVPDCIRDPLTTGVEVDPKLRRSGLARKYCDRCCADLFAPNADRIGPREPSAAKVELGFQDFCLYLQRQTKNSHH